MVPEVRESMIILLDPSRYESPIIAKKRGTNDDQRVAGGARMLTLMLFTQRGNKLLY